MWFSTGAARQEMEGNRRIAQMVHVNGANMTTREVHNNRTAEADENQIATVAPGEAEAPMKHATTPYTQRLDPSILSTHLGPRAGLLEPPRSHHETAISTLVGASGPMFGC
jgi:hypothetical protein